MNDRELYRAIARQDIPDEILRQITHLYKPNISADRRMIPALGKKDGHNYKGNIFFDRVD